MALTGTRTFVGFGFGAIQAGLFFYEAYQSGAFGRLVVAEVLPDVVESLRREDGFFTVNIAHEDRIAQEHIGPVIIENPTEGSGREYLTAAVANAEEIATAVPSVAYYASNGPGSLHRILAEGLRRKAAQGGPRAVIYTAENHNHAAEILEARVLEAVPESERNAVRNVVCFLNTVIGKMSGVIVDPTEMQTHSLAPATAFGRRAFLVEAFNRILISRIRFPASGPAFVRGIAVFEEKDDLLPFEEAKLYGHNATHALAAYLGAAAGVRFIANLRSMDGVMSFLRRAFIEESGAALVRKYHDIDPLFTTEGYTHYASDLLTRMTNPFLLDTVERVGRDPARKLGWDDRLVGTMRLALHHGIEPRRYAVGAAAALAVLDPATLTDQTLIVPQLKQIWSSASPNAEERNAVLDRIKTGREILKRWTASGYQNLEAFLPG